MQYNPRTVEDVSRDSRNRRFGMTKSISTDVEEFYQQVDTGGGGVFMMNKTWKDEQKPSFINFISCFLAANSFCLNFVPIAPDFIFNRGGLSVAFIFMKNWDLNNIPSLFSRYGMELGRPTFVPVQDLEMGFEKIVKIVHARGVYKRQDAISKLKAELNQAVGSIEAIAKASKEYILQNTDLSAEKAEIITKFFRDPKLYLSPKIR